MQLFFENLEYDSNLTIEPINYSKTEVVWSDRAVGSADIEIFSADNKIQWVKELKYLGCWITPKLAFGTLIKRAMLKARQTVGIINSVQVAGSSPPQFRKALFL